MQGRGWRRRVRRIVIPGEIGVRYRPLLRRNNKATSTMKITTIGRNAVGSFGVGLFLLSTFPMFGQGTIASYRLGDNTGEDWEPAIVADGSYVYALWPHYAATPYHDSSGATCIPYNAKGTGNTTIDYM